MKNQEGLEGILIDVGVNHKDPLNITYYIWLDNKIVERKRQLQYPFFTEPLSSTEEIIFLERMKTHHRSPKRIRTTKAGVIYQISAPYFFKKIIEDPEKKLIGFFETNNDKKLKNLIPIKTVAKWTAQFPFSKASVEGPIKFSQNLDVSALLEKGILGEDIELQYWKPEDPRDPNIYLNSIEYRTSSDNRKWAITDIQNIQDITQEDGSVFKVFDAKNCDKSLETGGVISCKNELIEVLVTSWLYNQIRSPFDVGHNKHNFDDRELQLISESSETRRNRLEEEVNIFRWRKSEYLKELAEEILEGIPPYLEHFRQEIESQENIQFKKLKSSEFPDFLITELNKLYPDIQSKFKQLKYAINENTLSEETRSKLRQFFRQELLDRYKVRMTQLFNKYGVFTPGYDFSHIRRLSGGFYKRVWTSALHGFDTVGIFVNYIDSLNNKLEGCTERALINFTKELQGIRLESYDDLENLLEFQNSQEERQQAIEAVIKYGLEDVRATIDLWEQVGEAIIDIALVSGASISEASMNSVSVIARKTLDRAFFEKNKYFRKNRSRYRVIDYSRPKKPELILEKFDLWKEKLKLLASKGYSAITKEIEYYDQAQRSLDTPNNIPSKVKTGEFENIYLLSTTFLSDALEEILRKDQRVSWLIDKTRQAKNSLYDLICQKYLDFLCEEIVFWTKSYAYTKETMTRPRLGRRYYERKYTKQLYSCKDAISEFLENTTIKKIEDIISRIKDTAAETLNFLEANNLEIINATPRYLFIQSPNSVEETQNLLDNAPHLKLQERLEYAISLERGRVIGKAISAKGARRFTEGVDIFGKLSLIPYEKRVKYNFYNILITQGKEPAFEYLEQETKNIFENKEELLFRYTLRRPLHEYKDRHSSRYKIALELRKRYRYEMDKGAFIEAGRIIEDGESIIVNREDFMNGEIDKDYYLERFFGIKRNMKGNLKEGSISELPKILVNDRIQDRYLRRLFLGQAPNNYLDIIMNRTHIPINFE